MRAVERTMPFRQPTRDAASARLSEGISALTGEPLLDGADLLAAVQIMSQTLAHDASDAGLARAIDTVHAALSAHTLDSDALDALAAAALGGTWELVVDVATRLDLDEHALVATLDYATRPALRRAALELRPILAAVSWTHGICPACGAPPLLAELRGPERTRTFRCGRCASAWEWSRFGCPACGERDHRLLQSLHAEGEGEFRRAECCDRCHRYVKSLATLEPFSADALLEADLDSIGLDWAAVERGYTR
jgi:FdhE protein